MTDDRLTQIENELQKIKERNAKVEADKAWEVSYFRIGVICAMTYVILALLLSLIGAQKFWLNAIVPVAGFYLSAQSLPAIKRWWIATRFPSEDQRSK